MAASMLTKLILNRNPYICFNLTRFYSNILCRDKFYKFTSKDWYVCGYWSPVIKCSYSSESVIQLKNKHSKTEGQTFAHTNSKDERKIVEFGRRLKTGPALGHFIASSQSNTSDDIVVGNINKFSHPYLNRDDLDGSRRKVYFDVNGCQMNVNDTEIAWSILSKAGYTRTTDVWEADVILVMTCSIRENAENKIWKHLSFLRGLKIRRKRQKDLVPLKIGILGCMAERLKLKILDEEKSVDVVAGPDSYKDLPAMLSITDDGNAAVNVILSMDETYADIMPIRLSSSSPSAFVSIMRGCDNMCSYCIVPFTRGRERSRPFSSIKDEVRSLSDQGIKEIVLLGQNVNSYRDLSETSNVTSAEPTRLAQGFETIYKTKVGGKRFADLLDEVSLIDPEIRIRFTSPHPKDFPNQVLELISERYNICNQLHMPAQSGNTNILRAMRRGYSRDAYLKLVDNVKAKIPDVALSSDFICGFCGETDEAHRDTISLMEAVKYNTAYVYPYSLREKTHAYHRLADDVPIDVKKKRAQEAIEVFRKNAHELNRSKIGQQQLILIEGKSKRSEDFLAGRNDGNIKVIVPDVEILDGNSGMRKVNSGDYVVVEITDGNSQVLKGRPIQQTTLKNYAKVENSLNSL